MSARAPHDELAELRRRAYGPDGAADGSMLERLQQLEDALRVPASADPADDVDPDGVDLDAVPSSTAGTPDDAVPPAAPSPPARERVGRTLHRRRVLLTLAAVAAVAALVAVVWSLTRTDGTVLRRVEVNDTAAQQPLASSLRTYGLDPDSYVQFESFEDLAVWTARIPDRGLRCLLVVDPAAVNVTFNGLVGWNCTPDGLRPTVDVVQYAQGSELGDRPAGSVARFVFLGDRVETTVVEARAGAVGPTSEPG